jgi:hypothetical protein
MELLTTLVGRQAMRPDVAIGVSIGARWALNVVSPENTSPQVGHRHRLFGWLQNAGPSPSSHADALHSQVPGQELSVAVLW